MRLPQALNRIAVVLAATMAAWTADAGTVVSQKFQSPTLKREWVYNVYSLMATTLASCATR
jgi:hypothetical protein